MSDGTYAAFIALMAIGAILALMICDADKIVREDNTKVIVMKNPSWSTEIKGLWETLYSAPWVVLLFPMFFSSNIFYTYQNVNMNLAQFNVRTRALNNLLYWLAQIFGALIIGYALDISSVRRSVRAKISLVVLFVLTFAIWGGGYAWQKDQRPREIAMNPANENDKIDWDDGAKRFVAPMILYFFYGFFDAAWQTCIYWYMGALSNSGRKTANFAGKFGFLFSLQDTSLTRHFRFLQGYPIRRRCHLLAYGRSRQALRHHLCRNMGLPRRLARHRCTSDLYEDPRLHLHGGRPQVQRREDRGRCRCANDQEDHRH